MQDRTRKPSSGKITIALTLEQQWCACTIQCAKLVAAGVFTNSIKGSYLNKHEHLCTHTWHASQYICIVTQMHQQTDTSAHTSNTFIRTYIHTCIHIHTYIRTYVHTHCAKHTYMRKYIHTHIHTYMRTYIHTYMLTYLHTYIHTYIQAYSIHTYIHTYTHAHMPVCIQIFGSAVKLQLLNPNLKHCLSRRMRQTATCCAKSGLAIGFSVEPGVPNMQSIIRWGSVVHGLGSAGL